MGVPEVINLRPGKAPHNLPLAATKPHTSVSFVPAYEELGYRVVKPKAGDASAPALARADVDDIDAWLRLRAHHHVSYLVSQARRRHRGD